MLRLVCIAVFSLLLMDADIPQVFRLRPRTSAQLDFPAGQSLPVNPTAPRSGGAAGKPEECLRPSAAARKPQCTRGEAWWPYAPILELLPSPGKGKLAGCVPARASRPRRSRSAPRRLPGRRRRRRATLLRQDRRAAALVAGSSRLREVKTAVAS